MTAWFARVRRCLAATSSLFHGQYCMCMWQGRLRLLISHLSANLDQVLCENIMTRTLPQCGHQTQLRCSEDASQHICKAQCRGFLECCSQSCMACCSSCPAKVAPTDETREDRSPVEQPVVHASHPCRRPLDCGHECEDACSTSHRCENEANCKNPCNFKCEHGSCRKPCSAFCDPCVLPCSWSCPHYQCDLSCSMVRILRQFSLLL